jgi:hypothetical protein
VRRGCISLGNIKCDKCNRTIPYPERYLTLEESKDKRLTLCMECCRENGMVKAESTKEGAEILFDLSND